MTTMSRHRASVPADAPMDERERFIDRIAERAEFQLRYGRASQQRTFDRSGLGGEPIDNAYGSGLQASGEWCDEELNFMVLTEHTVFGRFFSMAVNEAVHEALEWFRIDGRPVLDPHGEHEQEVWGPVGALVDTLWALQNVVPRDVREPDGTLAPGGVDILVDAPDEERDQFIDAIALRTGFQLTYSRAAERRVFHSAGLSSRRIDDAYNPGRLAPGAWCDARLFDTTLTEDVVFARFFSMAITEAVHEALEWFRIDDRLALDPHGEHELAILKASDVLVAALWALCADHPEYALTVRVNSNYDEPVHIRKVGYEGLTTKSNPTGKTLCDLPLVKGWDLRSVDAEPEADPDHGEICVECLGTWRAANEHSDANGLPPAEQAG